MHHHHYWGFLHLCLFALLVSRRKNVGKPGVRDTPREFKALVREREGRAASREEELISLLSVPTSPQLLCFDGEASRTH